MSRSWMLFFTLAGLAGLAGSIGEAHSQKTFPSKAVRFVSPFSAGGSTDILARILGQKLNEAWGQPVVVENRPGAGGNVGAEAVAKAPADGHTLLLSASSVAINPSLYKKMSFDTVKDLVPVALAGTAPNILLVHPSLPVHNVSQFIAFAKRDPNRITYASGGSGTGSHLIAELFQQAVNIRLVHIPYKGSGPAVTAFLSGECAVAFNNIIAAIPHVKSGKMRALALTSARRSDLLPGVPTIAEAAVPGFDADSWYGVFTTGGSPPEALKALNLEINRILGTAEIAERYRPLGINIKTMNLVELQDFMRSEMAKWDKVVKVSKARVD